MALLSSANQTFAQSQTSPKDSVKEERNVMLNASDATKPREIPIGLSSSDVTVYENGLPAVYSSSLHSLSAHWRSDMGQAGVGLMNPMESAIATGNIAYSVVSSLKAGEERFKGVLNYQGNHFGWNQFDLNVSGPLGKGWYYAGTMYQSFDPGTFKLQFTDFQDRMQLYRGVITHKWGKENELSFIYKYTSNRLAGYLASTAPFIYVGDGSVKEVEGFALGTSSYLPVDGKIAYRDLMTGKEYNSNFRDGMGNHANDIGVSLKYVLPNHWKLNANARYSYADVKSTTVGTTTITDVVNGREAGTDNSNIYYLNGELFTGKRQGSMSYYHEATVQNYLFTADLSKKWNGHDFKAGINEWGIMWIIIPTPRCSTARWRNILRSYCMRKVERCSPIIITTHWVRKGIVASRTRRRFMCLTDGRSPLSGKSLPVPDWSISMWVATTCLTPDATISLWERLWLTVPRWWNRSSPTTKSIMLLPCRAFTVSPLILA